MGVQTVKAEFNPSIRKVEELTRTMMYRSSRIVGKALSEKYPAYLGPVPERDQEVSLFWDLFSSRIYSGLRRYVILAMTNSYVKPISQMLAELKLLYIKAGRYRT